MTESIQQRKPNDEDPKTQKRLARQQKKLEFRQHLAKMGVNLNKPLEVPPPGVKQEEGLCKFWLKKRNRFCGMTIRNQVEEGFCAEHATSTGVLRVPCPLDPTHSVDKNRLKAHLVTCNARAGVERRWVNVGINRPRPVVLESKNYREMLQTMPVEDFHQVVKKIQTLHSKLVEKFGIIPVEILSHPCTQERFQEKTNYKHILQQSSLLGHMANIGTLPTASSSNLAYVEFGAGKAEMSLLVHNAVGDPTTFVLLDRKNFKSKFDSTILRNSPGCVYYSETNTDKFTEEYVWKDGVTKMLRVKTDIADVDLQKMDMLKHHQVVAYSKHLCGPATDLTLKCLTNLGVENINGIVIALCCHQLLRRHSYISEISELSDDEFGLLITLTTWKVCGVREERNLPHWTGMTYEERVELGDQAKRILDYGRLDYLLQHGFKAKLVRYCADETPENVCLVAWK